EYKLFGAPVPGHDFNAQRVEWGQILEGSARELMAVERPDETASAAEDAEGFLSEALREGPMPTKELRAAAAAHGHAWRTVIRAKETLGIRAAKTGFDGGWVWQLPPPTTPKSANYETEECQQD